MDFKIELIAIPVTDVDRAKAFYTEKAGFNADHDFRATCNFMEQAERSRHGRTTRAHPQG